MKLSFGKLGRKEADNVATYQHPKPRSVGGSKVESKDKSVRKNRVSKPKFFGSYGTRYAIIIGDEGAILLYMDGKTVKSRNFIAHASADNLKEFEDILVKDKKAPLFMVIDSMDQSFIQQSLPPISSLGVKKLIQKRLDRDLAASLVKGYVLLGRDDSGRRDWNYLMVSLENSPHLTTWFDFVEKIDNRLKGIYLLSVEAEYVVKSLDAAMGLPKIDNKKTVGSKWKFFVVHNKVGGFRQVILKDGKIVFTRLTQPVGEVKPQVIAGNIEQEMSSTIEYMRRMSFKAQEGLDVYIIASGEINEALDVSRVSAQNVYKFTPFEVAEFLGIAGAAQATDQFGDVTLTAFIASSKSHRLVMNLPKAEKVNKIYNIISYQKVALWLISLAMLGYSGVLAFSIFGKYSEVSDLQKKQVAQQRIFDDLTAEIKKTGIDVHIVNDTVESYKQIGTEAHSPIAMLAKVRPAIIDSVVIRDIAWQGEDPTKPAQIVPNAGKSESLTLVLRFPDISNTTDAFNALAKKILNDVRAAFPNYKVAYTKLPDVLTKKSEAGEISFDDDKKVQEIDKASLEATLSITNQAGGGQ